MQVYKNKSRNIRKGDIVWGLEGKGQAPDLPIQQGPVLCPSLTVCATCPDDKHAPLRWW